MLYARKITEDGWFGTDDLDADSISELNVDNHGLSVWKIQDASDRLDVDKIALALAMINHKVEEFYMVLLDPAGIEEKYKWALAYKPQPGDTRYSQVKDEHTNFVVTSFWELGYLSEYIHELLKDTQNYRYYDVITLRQMAYDAAKEGRLTKSDVKDTQWKKVIKALENEQGEIANFWD